MDYKESAYEPWEFQGSLSDGEFWNAVRLDFDTLQTSRSAPLVPPVKYDTSQDTSEEYVGSGEFLHRRSMSAGNIAENIHISPRGILSPDENVFSLRALLDQVAFHGSLSDGEFLDGRSRIPDACPSPRMLKLPTSPPLKGTFDPPEFEASLNDEESQASNCDSTRCQPHSAFHEDDDFAENLPDLVFMHKRYRQGHTLLSNSSEATSCTVGLRGSGSSAKDDYQEPDDFERLCYPRGGEFPNARAKSGTTRVKSVRFEPLERCAKGTGCLLEQSEPSDCPCQAFIKDMRYTNRVERIMNRMRSEGMHSKDDRYIEVPSYDAVSLKAHDSTATERDRTCEQGHPSDAELRSGWQPDHNYAPTQPDIPSLTDCLMSLNPPTPHPKVYGELSDSDLHIRIAQVLDELRILNLALAKRNRRARDPEEPNQESAVFSESRGSSDSFYLSSALEAKSANSRDHAVLSEDPKAQQTRMAESGSHSACCPSENEGILNQVAGPDAEANAQASGQTDPQGHSTTFVDTSEETDAMKPQFLWDAYKRPFGTYGERP